MKAVKMFRLAGLCLVALIAMPFLLQAADLEPVTIKWYSVGRGMQPDHELVMKEVNKILGEKLNVTLEWTVFDWGSYDDKMRMKIAAGEEFDVCFTSLEWVVRYAENVAKGAFLPLTELLPKYAPTYWNTIPQKFWEAAKIKGDIYAAMNYQRLVDQRAMYLNKALVDKYNFDYKNAKTVEDFEPFLQQIKDNEPGIYPFEMTTVPQVPNYFMAGTNWDIDSYEDPILQFTYVPYNTEDYTVEGGTVISETERKAFEKTHEWYKKGFIRKDAATIESMEAEIGTGKIAMWCRIHKPGGAADYSNKFGFDIVAVPINFATVRSRSVLSGMLAVSQTSKNPERAVMVMEELFKNKELYNLMAFGIEGTHYTHIDEDTIEPVENTRYFSGIAWELANQFNAYYLKGQEKGIWEETIRVNDTAQSSPIAGFVVDASPIKTELANLQAVRDQYYNGLHTGTLDPAKYVPVYEKALQAADPDNAVLKEVQRQLNEWVEAKDK